MVCRTPKTEANACECVFLICVYDNEEGDAVVCRYSERMHYTVYSFNEAYPFSKSYLFPR